MLHDAFSPQLVASLVSGAFGVLAGAFVTGRVQTRRQLISELNSVSSAISLCFTICNKGISLKSQQVQKLLNDYERAKAAYQDAQRQPERMFSIQADLQEFPAPAMPLGALERHLFEKLTIGGRALSAAVELIAVIELLKHAVGYRSELIEEIQRKSPMPKEALAQIYLGVPAPNNITDARFGSNVAAIYRYTEDCIFFAHLLAEDLTKYGNRLRRRGRWRGHFFLPSVPKTDWTKAEEAGLLPPKSQYQSWLSGFAERQSLFRRLRILVRADRSK
jgi:hypothetical protein